MSQFLQFTKLTLLTFALMIPSIYGGATENCSNGIDDDADGLIDCGDTDCYGDAACADAFECTNTLYQVISNTLKRLDVASSSYIDVGPANSNYNGAGFNFQDGYIYGIKAQSGIYSLWRIDAAGVETNLGPILNFGGIHYAGDFDQSGNLYTYKSGSYPAIYYVDVDQFPLVHQSATLTNLTGGSIPTAADITFNPVTNKFYGMSSSRSLVIIDPVANTVEVDGSLSGQIDASGAFGAAYADSEGNCYFSNNADGRIFKLTFDSNGDPLSLTHVATGSPTNSNDGMACSNSLPPFETNCGDGIDNDGDGLVDCDDPDCFVDSACPRLDAVLTTVNESGPGGIVPFHLRLINNSQADAVDFCIDNVLPQNFVFISDSIAFSGGASQTDVQQHPAEDDTDTISWCTLNLPVGDTIEIMFNALVTQDAADGTYTNTAQATGVLMDPTLVTADIALSLELMAAKTPFVCEPAFYQVYKKKGEPNVYARLQIETGGYEEIATISYQANGLGFDYGTGLAYGSDGKYFISLDQAGVVENYGKLFAGNVFVGDTDTLGHWFGKDKGNMVKIDIETKTIEATYSGQGMPGWDMAYNKDGNFYSVHNSTLYKFDPTTGTKSTVGAVSGGIPTSGYGAQWTGSDGKLYISNNNTGNIYRIDVDSRVAQLMMTSTPGLQYNDGFSCPTELPAPLNYDLHDYSGFGPAQIFTFAQQIGGVPILDAVWAGTGISYEPSIDASVDADADAFDDGLDLPSFFAPGTSIDFDVNLNTNQSNVDAYYGLWIDFDGDTVVDTFVNGMETISGASTVTRSLTVPMDYVDGHIKARLIVAEKAINESDININADDTTGEVEDYSFYGSSTVDCGNGIDDDGDGLVDCDDPDCFESCKYTTTKSSFDGGLESNNRLSQKISLTNYKRKRGYIQNRNRRYFQRKVNKAEMDKAADKKRLKSGAVAIESYMPIGAIPGRQYYESSPQHLIDLTNATDLVSVDIYDGADRTAAVLGLISQNGVYEHTKYVCDRLAGSKILDVLTYTIDLDATTTHDIIIPKLMLAEGNVEYAFSFSLREEGNDFIFESHWNLDNYTKDVAFYNFQVWASSVRDLELLIKEIFRLVTDTSANGKNIASYSLGEAPSFFINDATFERSRLKMNVTNKEGLTSIDLKGLYSPSETIEIAQLDMTLPLTGAETEHIEFDVNGVFDMGITFYHDQLTTNDVIFVADGPWNTSYDANVDALTTFEVSNTNDTRDHVLPLNRSVYMAGEVQNFIALFRPFDPNFTPHDVSEYQSLDFTAAGRGTLEVAIVKESIGQWELQAKRRIELTEEAQDYSWSIAHFLNGLGQTTSWEDIYMVQFTIVGDGANMVPFSLDLSNVAFSQGEGDDEFVVYTEGGNINPLTNEQHTANRPDDTDMEEVAMTANGQTETIEIFVKNTGDTIMSIDQIDVDSRYDDFHVDFIEYVELAPGEGQSFTVSYIPRDYLMESEAMIWLTVNGQEGLYSFKLKAVSVCPSVDHVATADVQRYFYLQEKQFKSAADLSSDAVVAGTNVVFKGANSIELQGGFEVTAGKTLDVEISDECNNPMNE